MGHFSSRACNFPKTPVFLKFLFLHYFLYSVLTSGSPPIEVKSDATPASAEVPRTTFQSTAEIVADAGSSATAVWPLFDASNASSF